MTITTEHFLNGTGSATTFAYTFPYYKTSDIKVKVGGTLKTESTHYNVTGTNIVFTSGNLPPSGTGNVHIYRETDVDTSKATFAAGSSIRATDLNNNELQLLYNAQEQNFNKIQTADLQDDAVTSAKLATDAVGTDALASNAVLTASLANSAVSTDKIANLAVTAAKLADANVTTGKISGGAVTSAKIATGAVVADGLASNAVTTAKLATGAVTADEIGSSAVTTAKIDNSAVTAAKIATDSVTTAKILDANVTTNKIANDAVTADKLADSINAAIATNTAKTGNATHTGDVTGATSLSIADGAVVTDRIADDAVTTDKLANSINSAITANTAKVTNATHTGEVTGATALTIANNAVTTAKIADDAITTAKIANDAVTGAKIADLTITGSNIANNTITHAQIGENAVTISEISDAELTTLAGMQSGTASVLASSTALTSTTAELNLLDGKSIVTTIGGSATDEQLPSAQAVNERIIELVTEVGGFVPIVSDFSFPNTNPDVNDGAGTIVSIADAGGLVVNGSGVSTTGRTLGGSTVTINGIDSSLNNTTIAAGQGMLVETTSTLNTYTYHRLIVDEAGVANAKTAVDDFNERYRVGASNPTSSLDDGDLFFNTSTDKMLVYNATGSSWDEVQSVGNYFINTISSYSGTGGNSATFNGSAYRFVLSNPGTVAEQHLVSVNGVIQKPTAGTSQPAEGFAIDGSSILFSAAPASGSDYFIITIGASVNVGTPSDNTVDTDIIQNLAVTTAKIAADAVTGAKIADDAVGAEHIEVLDATLQFGDSVKAQFGAGNDLQIWHNGNDSVIRHTLAGSGNDLWIESDTNIFLGKTSGAESIAKFVADGACELYYDNTLRLETTASGVTITGSTFIDDSSKGHFGTDNDLQVYHTGSDGFLNSDTGQLYVRSDNNVYIQPANGENGVVAIANGAVQLYHNNAIKINTNAAGVTVSGNVDISNGHLEVRDSYKARFGDGQDLQIYHDASGGHNHIHGATNCPIIFKTNDSERCRITSGGDLNFENDSSKITLGTGQDLKIYHDGSHNYIEGTTSGQYTTLRNVSGNIIIQAKSGENSIWCGPDSDVELYYDGSKKLETTSGGVTITGDLTVTGSAPGGVTSDSDRNTVAGTNAGDAFQSGNAVDNTLFGYDAGTDITSAARNTLIGSYAGDNITTGGKNVAIGNKALTANTTGIENVLIGDYAGSSITTGSDNIGIGKDALGANTTASSNVAIGKESCKTSTTAAFNVGVGDGTLKVNTANNGTAVGYRALVANTSGGGNTGIGYVALTTNTTGAHNTALGSYAANGNTTGQRNTAIGDNALYSNTTGNYNTAVGSLALDANTDGTSNVAVGYETLSTATTATRHTAVGYKALRDTSSGTDNTGIGYISLFVNTTGSTNTGVGAYSLHTNTTATGNTAVGYNSLGVTTTGGYNVAIGRDAMDANTTGYENVAVGYAALGANTTAPHNTALGFRALKANTTGENNVAVGKDALYVCTTGQNDVAIGVNAAVSLTSGNNNIAIGSQSLEACTTANDNTAVGYKSLEVLTTGDKNTAVGYLSGDRVTTGVQNVCIGYDAGGGITTGSKNVLIGYGAATSMADNDLNTAVGHQCFQASYGIGNTALGYYAGYSNTNVDRCVFLGYRAGDDQMSIGSDNELWIARDNGAKNTAGTWIHGASNGACYQGNDSTAWSTSSDVRLKKDITDYTTGLSIIDQVKVRNYKHRTHDEIDLSTFPEGTTAKQVAKQQDTDVRVGIIANELETIAPRCVSTGAHGVKTVDTDELFWDMINAIKELSTKNTALEARIATLEAA